MTSRGGIVLVTGESCSVVESTCDSSGVVISGVVISGVDISAVEKLAVELFSFTDLGGVTMSVVLTTDSLVSVAGSDAKVDTLECSCICECVSFWAVACCSDRSRALALMLLRSWALLSRCESSSAIACKSPSSWSVVAGVFLSSCSASGIGTNVLVLCRCTIKEGEFFVVFSTGCLVW